MTQPNENDESFEVRLNDLQEGASPRIVILGNSGLAKEVYSVLCTLNTLVSRIVFFDKSQEQLLLQDDLVYLGMGSPLIREECFKAHQNFCDFPILVHPYSTLGLDVIIGKGTFIQAGVAITTQVHLGQGCLVNLNATIGHDVSLGDYSVVNPGATISGNVVVGKSVLIGANATILEKVSIGDGARIGAGAVVTKDVKKGETVVGVPARPV
jgi:sugar O-acyltransferase (sialic acid O-acetyltransferase NeuD family)